MKFNRSIRNFNETRSCKNSGRFSKRS